MNQKVILILADGLRPDAMLSCGNPYGSRLLTLGSYSLEAKTVYVQCDRLVEDKQKQNQAFPK